MQKNGIDKFKQEQLNASVAMPGTALPIINHTKHSFEGTEDKSGQVVLLINVMGKFKKRPCDQTPLKKLTLTLLDSHTRLTNQQ